MRWVTIDLEITDSEYRMLAETPCMDGGSIRQVMNLPFGVVERSGGGLWTLVLMAVLVTSMAAAYSEGENMQADKETMQ